jgi:hypothetical protein
MKNLEPSKEPSPERGAKIMAGAAAVMTEEMTLRDLRSALSQTQTTVGNKLGIGQEGVSRIERRSDLLLSTLRGYVEAVGGNLSLIVEFPDRGPVSLSVLGFSLEKEASLPGHRRQSPDKHAERRANPHEQVATAKA